MSSITVKINPIATNSSVIPNTFEYTVAIADSDLGTGTPKSIDANRSLIQSVRFEVTLGDRLIFQGSKPFTIFFRYGRPDRGDYNSTDEEKQTRSQLTLDENRNPIHRTSLWALLLGLYDPVVILLDGENFIHDHGLGFEVRPAGA